MLTIFCSPKPFCDQARTNQLTALRSWRNLGPDVEIYLFGSADGSAAAASEVGAIHWPDIQLSPTGAPSFNAMAEVTQERGRWDLQVYANADIVFDNTLPSAMSAVASLADHFLLVGERLDLPPAVCAPRSAAILAQLRQEGTVRHHGPTGADYFGYRRGQWTGLPPVYMGRAMCDQALLHHCFKTGTPVIDATPSVVALHQYHDYSHVPGGEREVREGADFVEMSRSHSIKRRLPTIADADVLLMPPGRLVAHRRRGRILRHLELACRYRWRLPMMSNVVGVAEWALTKVIGQGRS